MLKPLRRVLLPQWRSAGVLHLTCGSATITTYRIFYGNGENVSVPSIVTRIILSLNEDSVGETVSLRSEADQVDLISEFINVTIKINVGM